MLMVKISLNFTVVTNTGDIVKQDAIVADKTIWWDELKVYEGLTA